MSFRAGRLEGLEDVASEEISLEASQVISCRKLSNYFL